MDIDKLEIKSGECPSSVKKLPCGSCLCYTHLRRDDKFDKLDQTINELRILRNNPKLYIKQIFEQIST